MEEKKKPISVQYTSILPSVYQIEASQEYTREESRRKILALALSALQNSKTQSFDKHRMDLLKCKTDKDLVRLIERTIEKGRNFTNYGT